MDSSLLEFGARLGLIFVPFLFALCFHEVAHGVVAKWCGDDTADRMGRLSLNPMVHADPLGTWVLPITAILFGSPFFFGWAKPVPVDSRNFRNKKWDMFWVALAGPASNVLLAIVATVVLGVVYAYFRSAGFSSALIELLRTFIMINMFLAFFNLIPIHPLDGGKVLEPFLPIRWNMWLEENQGSLNMGLLLLFFVAGPILALPVKWMLQELLYLAALIGQYLV